MTTTKRYAGSCFPFCRSLMAAMCGAVLAVLIMAGGPGSQAMAESLTIACYQDYRPYSYVSDEGKPEGLLIDFWTLWGQRNQVTITFLPGFLSQGLERVKSGQADVMIGLFKSEERSAFLDFSNPFMEVHTNLYVRDDSPVGSIEEFSAKLPVGVVKDGFAASFFKDRYPNVTVKAFKSPREVTDMAVAGKLNAFALDFPNALFLMAEHDSFDKFKSLKTLYKEKLRAGVRKGNTPLLTMINQGLDNVPQKDVDALYTEWGIVPKPFFARHRGWALGGVVILLAGCIGFGFYVLRLKSRLRKLKLSGHLADSNDWAQIIAKGENDWVEFKSSLRWNLKTEKTDKNLEAVIVKTLSAFMNARGGTLFIGISDDGEPLGIEADYQTFQKKPNRDGFMLKLSDLVSKNLGRHSHEFIVIQIQPMDGKDVCRILVKPGERPVFVTDQGKEAFYIRAGASSVPLSMSEAHEYINSRWQG